MGKGHGEKLSRKQEQAIAALLSEPTVEAAAKQADVSHNAMKGWLKNPAFQAAYRAAKRAVLEETVAALQRAAGDAVEALKRNLTCAQPASEIRAAQVILEQAAKGLESVNLLAEIEELRRRLEEQEQAHEHGGLAAGADPLEG